MIIRFNTILFFLVCLTLFAQAQVDTLWTKTFGGSSIDLGNCVNQTVDGGYVIVGGERSMNTTGYSDVWLIKTDTYGDTLWTKTYGGSTWDLGSSVQQTSDSGYIITGYTDAFGSGLADVWLIKTNSFGDTIWTKTFGGNKDDYGYSVQQTLDGGYIITGGTDSFSASYSDVWLIKTNNSGYTLWTKTYGGISVHSGSSVKQTTDGGYIIVGETYSTASSSDIWLIKTNSSGDTIWTKTFGGSESDKGRSVYQTIDGGYIITGYTDSFGAGSDDVWLIKTDRYGNAEWDKTFGGNLSDVGRSVQQTSDGGYIIVGDTRSFPGYQNVWLIKTDSFGDTLWTKIYGGNADDLGSSVQETTDGGYIITGYTGSFGAGLSDVWLIKTTPDVSSIAPNTDLIISDFSLQQNFPNPFNPSTKISWKSPASSWQTLKVFDVLGNEIETLVNGEKPTGSYEITWFAGNLPSGVYFYQLRMNGFVATKKMVLMK
jgi:hypothetical protein